MSELAAFIWYLLHWFGLSDVLEAKLRATGLPEFVQFTLELSILFFAVSAIRSIVLAVYAVGKRIFSA